MYTLLQRIKKINASFIIKVTSLTVPGDPKKTIPLIVLICQFKRKSSIKDLFNGIVAKHLEVICAKDGRYIFINKNVMSISVKHDFQDNIYKFQ